MKAVRYYEFGDPDVLRYEEIEQPSPGAGEVRVRVAATSFNPVDAGIRSGSLRGPFPVNFPHIPGIDVAGTVDALGEGVDGLLVGDAVIGFLPMVADGASAKFVNAPAEALTAAPTSIPLEEAAALPLTGVTAWQALFETGELATGQRLLINGAGGTVGGYAVQLARQAGVHVIATASPRSSERIRQAGANEVIDHTRVDVSQVVTEPVDLLLNLAPVAPEQLAAMLALVRPGGMVVNTTVWMQAPSDESRGVRGVNIYVRNDVDQLARLVSMVDRGELHIDVAERVPLSELRAVHARAASGNLPGKVIVIPAAS